MPINELEEIMKEVRAQRRAASAFRMKKPRMAVNQWRAMLELRQEARKELVFLCAQSFPDFLAERGREVTKTLCRV